MNKKIPFIAALVVLAGQAEAQVQVDKAIQLTGTTSADRHLTGLSVPQDSTDAVSATSIQRSYLTYATGTGTGTQYSVNLPLVAAGYTTGMVVSFKAPVANTGGITLNVNGLGAKTVFRNVNVQLEANDIKAGQIVSAIYDGTNFQVISQLSQVSGFTGQLAGEVVGPQGATLIVNNAITTNKIADGAVTTPKLANSAVTTIKIADDAVTTPKILDANVTTAKIADANVTTAKIADANVTTAKIADANVTTPKIADANVTTAKIADANVTTAKLADANITTAKLADGSVTSLKILDGAIVNADVNAAAAIAYSKLNLTNSIVTADLTNGSVTTAKIADANVTTAKLADQSVTTPKIADNAVTTIKIADANVTTAKIADANITTAKIADANVTTVKLADGSVNSLKILDGTIVNADVNAAAAIAYSKLNLANSIVTADLTDNSVTTSKIADANVTTAKIADANVTTAKLADGSVTSAKILDGTIVNADVNAAAAIAYSKLALTNSIVTADLTNNAVTTAKITDANVTTAKLADDAVTTVKILDANVTTPKIADGAVTDAKVANGISYSKLSGAPTSLPPTGAAGGDLTGTYPNPTVAANAITTAKILDANVTTAKIADANVTTAKIADANVTTAKLADGSVTDAKVANGISYSKLSGAPTSLPPSGAAGGDLTGTYPNPTVAANAVTTAKILDANVTTAKLADGSVTDAKVANGISYSKLSGAPTSLPPSGAAGGDLTGTYPNPTVAANAVTTAKILDANVTTAKLADDAVTTVKILDANVTTSKLADGSVTDAKVANGISYSKLTGAPTSLPPSGAAGGDLTGTFPNPTVANSAITSAKILDGTVVNADISPTAAIAYSKLALTNSIVTADLTNGSVTTAKVDATGAASGNVLTYNGTNVAWIAPASTLPPSGAAGGSLSGTYPNPTIAAGAITNAEVNATAGIVYSKLNLTNSIQNGDIVPNAITTSKVANGTVTTSKMADSAISGLKLLTGAVGPKHISTIGAAAGQAMVFDGTNVVWAAAGGSPTGAAGGSLSGTYPNPTIAAGAITNTEVSGTAAIAYSKLALTNSIQNADIVANAITTSKVANGTVTTSKMADSAISGLKLLTGAVGPKHISTIGAAAGQAMVFDGTNVVWAAAGGSPTGAAGGSLSGTYPNPTIAAGAITNTEVSGTAAIAYSKLALTNSIANGDITANAITTSKVANGTVTTSKMADSAISGLKLLTGAVGPKHISTIGAAAGQSLTFDGTNVVWAAGSGGSPTGAAGGSLAGTYPNPSIAAGAIGSTEIADGSITNADIAAAAGIPYSKLALTNSIQNADIVANAITTSKVANGTVTTSKMADSAISGLKLLTGAVGPKHISTIGAGSGQALMYNGTNVVWSTPTVASVAPVVVTNSAASPISVDFSASAGIKNFIINRGGTTGAYTANITLPASSNYADGDIITVYIANGAGGAMTTSLQMGGVTTLYSFTTSAAVDVTSNTLLTGTTTSLIRFLRVNASTWYRIL